MSGLVYLIQVNVYLLAFYIFYRLLLSKETFFNLNRMYLISGALISFLIPLLNSDWINGLFITDQVKEAAQNINLQAYAFLYQDVEQVDQVKPLDILNWIYFTGVSIFLCRLFYRLYQVIKQLRNHKSSVHAFSFFKYIAVAENMAGRNEIMAHEKVHARQWHSFDVLFFEVIAIINWFNPVAYWYKLSIKNIHEYIADEKAAEKSKDKETYAMLLLNQAFGVQTQALTNQFFNQSLIKKRIIMLQKTKSKWVALLKYGLSAPLFLAMLVLSSAFVSEKSTSSMQILENSAKSDTIAKRDPIFIVDGKEMQKSAIDKIDPKNIKSVDVRSQSGNKNTKDTVVINTVARSLTTVEKTGEKLVYILDGKEVMMNDPKLMPENIESVNVLKGKAATDKYRALNADQIIEITSKKKEAGANQIEKEAEATKVIVNKSKADITVGGKQPLYVLDGIIVKENFEIKSINPNDIESINVLKDKSATEKYGEKGADGVIEIILKKIKKD